MKKYSSILALALIMIGATETVNASPITYNFTATSFQTHNQNSIPQNTISGSFTSDGSTLTQIDLTIGSHSYSVSEVTVDHQNGWLGANLNGINSLNAGTQDFLLTWYPWNYSFQKFYYSVPEVYDILKTGWGSIAPAPVPIPSSAWLLGSGLLGLISTLRKRRN